MELNDNEEEHVGSDQELQVGRELPRNVAVTHPEPKSIVHYISINPGIEMATRTNSEFDTVIDSLRSNSVHVYSLNIAENCRGGV